MGSNFRSGNNTSAKGIIFVPYAQADNLSSGVNIKHYLKRVDTYLKNCCVALTSAKQQNPHCDVAIVTNMVIPKYYRDILSSNEILILEEDFDEFSFDYDIKWALAFYKLAALSKLVSKYDYEYYCYLDSDVYVSAAFETIWAECDDHIMMYDINHGLTTYDYNAIVSEWEAFLGEKKLLTHYGGEFFAANRGNAKLFVDVCQSIAEKMRQTQFATTKGDEFIISLAAQELKDKVKNAGAYIYRFWTGQFYLVSTSYKYNPVTILHLPSEKERGILKIFNNYTRKGKVPPQKAVWKLCHLQRQSIKHKVKNWLEDHSARD